MAKEQAPALFPLFRSRLTTAVLTFVFLGDDEYSIARLAEAVGTDTGNMTREVARLEQAGVVTSRRVGRTKLVRPNKDAPFYEPLYELITITLGPGQVLAEELAGLAGIEEASVFGSWAARMMGQAGPSPADIDVLVVGRPDRDDLDDAASRASARLQRKVNTVVVSPRRWKTADDRFLDEVRSKPRVFVISADAT